MYGSRARIGFIAPASTIDTTGYEFYQMAPPGVIMVGTIMGIRILTDEDIGRALEALDRVAEQYSREPVDIVILGGSPPVIHGGIGSEKELADRMQRASGIQATTSQVAAIAALKALGVKRLAIASPFDDHQNGKLKKYLEGNGFEVVSVAGGVGVPLKDYSFLANETSYRLGREAIRKAGGKADGLYLPCAKWPTVENIALLEKDTHVPVVSSIQGMLWYCLRKLGLRDRIEGFGKLFEVEEV